MSKTNGLNFNQCLSMSKGHWGTSKYLACEINLPTMPFVDVCPQFWDVVKVSCGDECETMRAMVFVGCHPDFSRTSSAHRFAAASNVSSQPRTIYRARRTTSPRAWALRISEEDA